MPNHLEPGLTGEARTIVDEYQTATALGSGHVPVYGTPALVALLEMAAVHALEGVLPSSATSVGVHLDVRHLAPTPVGLSVRSEARLEQVEGRKLTFSVVAFDAAGKIAEGTHRRLIVDRAAFLETADAKLSASHHAGHDADG